MRDLFGWWRARSQPERFDLSVRATLFLVSASEILALPRLVRDTPGPGQGVTLLFGMAHLVVCLVAVHAGIEHYLGRRDRPVRLVAAAVLVTEATIAAFLFFHSRAGTTVVEGRWNVGAAAVSVSCYLLGVLAVAVPPRWAVAGLAGQAGIVVVLGLLDGVPAGTVARAALFTLAGYLVFISGSRMSLWMLGVLWELERSRGTQVRLAVAEERLRFARDLHDVLGRNLSVIALKSELAAQLARRDRPSAVDEMLEVRRVAQESLAEVREVVRGYRTADLDAELAGARAVLGSAGVRCQVLGEGHGLSPQVQSALGWVVREGTTNVLRHSEAASCTVSLRYDGAPLAGPIPVADRATGADVDPAGRVVLAMENDGVPPGDRPEFGSGLLGLTERLAPLGGRVDVVRVGRDRFRLTADLPLLPPGRPPAPVSVSPLPRAAASGAVPDGALP